MKKSWLYIMSLTIMAITFDITSIHAKEDVSIKNCYVCHGKNFEKHALGKSKIVKDMNSTEIKQALIGYRSGSYGGNMKGLMKTKVVNYTDSEIDSVVKLIK